MPITHCPLLIAHCPSLITHSPITHYSQRDAGGRSAAHALRGWPLALPARADRSGGRRRWRCRCRGGGDRARLAAVSDGARRTGFGTEVAAPADAGCRSGQRRGGGPHGQSDLAASLEIHHADGGGGGRRGR